MTRSEAIKILWQYDVNFEPHPAEDVMHAIDMAIEALQQEPTAEYSSDVISRQAAIDAVKEAYENDEMFDGYEYRLQELPTAQPFTEEQIQTMQELESAQVEKAYELGKADRPTGDWIENDNGTFSCSNCQSWIPKEQHHYARYCLYCGADMRGGPTLTPEEFAEKMAGIAENGDEERKHVAADSIMCELLKSLGFGEGVGIFEDMDKWYS